MILDLIKVNLNIREKSHLLLTSFALFRSLFPFTNNTKRITDKEDTMYIYVPQSGLVWESGLVG